MSHADLWLSDNKKQILLTKQPVSSLLLAHSLSCIDLQVPAYPLCHFVHSHFKDQQNGFDMMWTYLWELALRII